MKQKSDNVMSTAAGLLAERRKYEAWLAALDSRRSTTPDHVYTRVHADYAARLEAVVSALGNNADALDARIAELTERSATLEADAQAVQDEKAEAELRAHVGELEADAWSTLSAELEERLAALAGERRAAAEELQSIRDMASAARLPTPGGMPAVDSPAPGEPAIADAAPAPAQEAAAGGDAPLVSEPATPSAKGAGFDELAFIRDIAGDEAGAQPAPSAPAPPAPSPAPAAPPAEATARSSGERPIDDSLGLVLPDESPAYAPRRRASTETPMAANIPGNTPIVLQAEKKPDRTLKCTECGSMNYPTEWYCERCGAELSAL